MKFKYVRHKKDRFGGLFVYAPYLPLYRDTIVGVQPMEAPTGKIFYMNLKTK